MIEIFIADAYVYIFNSSVYSVVLRVNLGGRYFYVMKLVVPWGGTFQTYYILFDDACQQKSFWKEIVKIYASKCHKKSLTKD